MHIVLSRHRHALSLLAAAASWGIAAVISKRAVTEIPPLTLLSVQLSVSVVLLLALLIARGRRLALSPGLGRLGALGLLNPGVSYALSLAGLTTVTASLSVLLWATEPLMIVGLAWWLLGERISKPLAAAVAVAATGVAFVVAQPGTTGRVAGIALTLAGVAACALYTVVAGKLMAAESTLEVVAAQQLAALGLALLLVGVVSVMNGYPELSDVSVEAWLSAVVSGMLYYAIAFWFYLSGLRRVPAAVAGLFINLVPVFGVAAGHILLSESLTPRQWVGGGIILIAVSATVILQSRSDSPSPPRKEPEARNTARHQAH
ncbi:MAG TPA: DMT family transporter [Acidimicrobiia bacterium]|nr:DMT family transporter [Acidimicrobiia bacterium]